MDGIGSSESRGRAVVAMSGGVDSSTTAALLLEQGYDVIGITMQLYDVNKTAMGSGRGGTCCSLDDVYDARRVAEHLGIPFYVVNFQEAFQSLIVDDLVAEYLAGRTPNPCVRCNEFMKFRLLLDRAVELGGDFLATGHYARIDQCPTTGRWRLRRGVYDAKDQSYFLYPVGQKQLERMRFPLGDMTKAEVRAHAARFNLPTAKKSESQDVCFIAGENYRQFIARTAGEKLPGQGEFVSTDGLSLGRHEGHHRFTVGQRKGIGLAAAEPRYVVRVEPEKNQVVVGSADDLFADGLRARRFRWVAGEAPAESEPLQVKIRYRSEPIEGFVRMVAAREAEIRFSTRERAITPGQTVVLYRGDEVVGGGVIVEAITPVERAAMAGESNEPIHASAVGVDG